MYAEIVLPLGRQTLERTLTYKVPEEWENRIKTGSTVQVPMRQRTHTGVVVELHDRAIDFATKSILNVKEGEGLLKAWQFKLARWMADYYQAPLYDVLKMMMPMKVWSPTKGVPERKAFQRTKKVFNGDRERLGEKQKAILEYFDKKPLWTREELKEFSLTSLRGLVKRGFIEETSTQLKGVRTGERTDSSDEPKEESKTLTPIQAEIHKTILDSDRKRFLIHGVTGSGKTEIYLQLARDTVEQGRQVILMAPEISLTPQLIDYFETAFEGKIAVLHSRLSAGEREREWWRIHRGEAVVAIGSRSAIFAPAHQLGLILIDEEHEWSYKQDRTPHYHSRTVAYELAEQVGAKVVLGSATPSLETRHAAQTGAIEYFEISKRVGQNRALPSVHLVDMREELRKENFSIFSDALSRGLHETLEAGRQALLFLNRRGSASSVLCRECGQTLMCSACDVSLTHHRFKEGWERLVCHHCGLHERMPDHCPHCQGTAIKTIGVGTERVERELQKRFPKARILRADRDTTARKGRFDEMYYAMKNGEADVLIGTQMISKGLDLPNVQLVGIILADIGLHLPDFRAAERSFQLLTQVAGRAGRGDHPGNVVIQTYNPDHLSLRAAASHDFHGFYEAEIAHREEFNHPPFSRIIKMNFKHPEQKICTREAAALTEALTEFIKRSQKFNEHQTENSQNPTNNPETYTVTSAPALIPRKHNQYHWHVFLQGPQPQPLLKEFLKTHPLKSGWIIDVDPMVMG